MSILDENDPEPTRSILDENDPEGPATPVRPGGPPPLGHPAPAAAPRNYGFFEALGEGFWNIPKGAGEFLGKVKDAYLGMQDPREFVPKAASAAVGIPGAVGQLLGGAYLNLTPEQTRQQLLAASPEEFAPMIEAANKVGGLYAERYGSWEAIKRTMAEHPYIFSADAATLLTAPGVGTAARAAGQAAARVVHPAVTNTARAIHYGLVPTHAMNDAAGAIASRAIPAAAGYAERVLHPTNALMMNAAEGRGNQIVNALATPADARQIVLGSHPTAAQTVALPVNPRTNPGVEGVNAPRFAALGKAAEKRLPTQATDIKGQQNAARLDHLRAEVAGTPATLQAAQDTRAANAAQNYEAAGVAPRTQGAPPPAQPVMVTADNQFLQLLNRPSMDRVMARAAEIAQERGVPFQVGNNTPGQWVPDPYGQNLPPTWQPPQYARYSSDNLHDVKQAFDDLAFDPTIAQRHGIGANELANIRNTRGQFIGWFENQNPAYGNARRQFAADSAPINQQQIGQHLERKLQNPTLAEDTMTQRADDFSRAVQEAPIRNPVIKQATGQTMADNLGGIFTPRQMDAVGDIQTDLLRAKLTESQAGAAGSHAGELNTAFSDALGTSPERWWSRGPISWMNERIADDVSNAMMTPEGAAQLMQNALARDAVLGGRRQLYDYMTRSDRWINPNTYNPWRIANRYPAMYNALGAQDEQTAR